MLSPEYLMSVSQDVIDIFSSVEEEIISDIARRVVKTGTFTDTAKWQLRKSKEFGLLQTDIEKSLSRATKKSEKEITRIMREASDKAVSYDTQIYKAVGLSPIAISDSPAMKALVLQGTGSTKMLMSNFTKTTAKNSKLAYINVIDEAYVKIMSGTFNPEKAMIDAIKKIAKNGVEKIAYPSGTASSIEASVRRAVTTGVNQSVSKLQLEMAEEMNCQLVETTSHAGARPTHAEWQGGIYCISGHHKRYGDLYKETGYGTGEGLCGWNCYHSFFPFYEGLSTSSFSRNPAKEYLGRDNDEMYEQQQKQRSYERQIRTAKKECIVYKEAFESAENAEIKEQLEKEWLKSSDRLRSKEEKLRTFLKDTGRTKEQPRVYVGGWDRNSMTTSKTKIKKNR